MEMTAMQSDAPLQPASDTHAVVNSEMSQPETVSASSSADVISDEVLRHRIRELIPEKTKQCKIRRAINHSLFALLVQFILTTLAGTLIVYYFNSQQQAAAARRSFVDEMNKMRVQRIGEVWEHLDVNEFLIDKILANNSRQGNNTDKDVEEIHRLIDDDLAIISKNRFWLGDDRYSRIRTYLDLNIQYALNQLMVTTPGIDLTDLHTKRERAKQDILRIRNIFLEGKE
jgi:hypothetical protein